MITDNDSATLASMVARYGIEAVVRAAWARSRQEKRARMMAPYGTKSPAQPKALPNWHPDWKDPKAKPDPRELGQHFADNQDWSGVAPTNPIPGSEWQ